MLLKRGPKKRKYINTTWSGNLAYAVGLLATDGNLSPDQRHILLTSKDEEIILMFKKILGLNNKIGKKGRGGSKEKNYFVIQFGSVLFYEFLLNIGLMPAKSKRLKSVLIPDEYFFDFLRGCIDGDGNINTFRHPESRHLQLRVRLASASQPFLLHILATIRRLGRIRRGWVSSVSYKSVFCLTLGKQDSITILRRMYHSKGVPCLKRKYITAKEYLGE